MKNKKILFRYLLLGLAASAICGAVLINWIPLLRIFDSSIVFDTQPASLKFLNSLLGWLPWIIGFWLIVKGIKPKRVLNGISFLIGVVIPYIAMFGFILGGPVVSDYASRTTFESNVWQQAENTNQEIRIKMVDDLLSHHKLVGKPRSEIDSLLGVPNKTGYFQDYEYVYWLGPERGFISIDSEWLGIKFKDNIVSEARILRD